MRTLLVFCKYHLFLHLQIKGTHLSQTLQRNKENAWYSGVLFQVIILYSSNTVCYDEPVCIFQISVFQPSI